MNMSKVFWTCIASICLLFAGVGSAHASESGVCKRLDVLEWNVVPQKLRVKAYFEKAQAIVAQENCQDMVYGGSKLGYFFDIAYLHKLYSQFDFRFFVQSGLANERDVTALLTQIESTLQSHGDVIERSSASMSAVDAAKISFLGCQISSSYKFELCDERIWDYLEETALESLPEGTGQLVTNFLMHSINEDAQMIQRR